MPKTLDQKTTLAVLLLLTAMPAAADAPLGVYRGAGCDGLRKLADFTAWFGRPPDLALDAFSTESWDALTSSADWAIGCWAQNGLPMVFSVPMLPRTTSDTLADGAAGKFDATFQHIAQTLVAKGYGRAVLRIGWEFNGNWFPWAASRDPQSWIAYWRRIVTVMRQVPGAAFQFDWCTAIGRNALAPDTVYPGDAYVDTIGADVYNQAWGDPKPTPEQVWNWLLNQPYGLKWQRDFALAHGKSISFPEWGTGTRPDGHGGGDDPYFLSHMADWIAANPVAYHIYWDYPAPDYNGRLSDGSQPAAGAVFLQKFGASSGAAP